MANVNELIERVNRIDKICMDLRYHALGFNMPIESFIGEMDSDEININKFLEFSIELSKIGYGLSNFYSKNDELVFRYFTMVALLMTHMAFPKETHNFTTLSYICTLFDDDYETFIDIADSIESDIFDKYLDKLEEETIFLISTLRDTFELLLVAYIENHTPCGVIDEVGNIVYSDIDNYIKNNSYDVLLDDILK